MAPGRDIWLGKQWDEKQSGLCGYVVRVPQNIAWPFSSDFLHAVCIPLTFQSVGGKSLSLCWGRCSVFTFTLTLCMLRDVTVCHPSATFYNFTFFVVWKHNKAVSDSLIIRCSLHLATSHNTSVLSIFLLHLGHLDCFCLHLDKQTGTSTGNKLTQ